MTGVDLASSDRSIIYITFYFFQYYINFRNALFYYWFVTLNIFIIVHLILPYVLYVMWNFVFYVIFKNTFILNTFCMLSSLEAMYLSSGSIWLLIIYRLRRPSAGLGRANLYGFVYLTILRMLQLFRSSLSGRGTWSRPSIYGEMGDLRFKIQRTVLWSTG